MHANPNLLGLLTWTQAAILTLAASIARSRVFEDRLEYDCEMLARAYALTLEDARILQVALHSHERDFRPF